MQTVNYELSENPLYTPTMYLTKYYYPSLNTDIQCIYM